MGAAICDQCYNIVVAEPPQKVEPLRWDKSDTDWHRIRLLHWAEIHYGSIAALVKSAETCPFCTALYLGFEHYMAKLFPHRKSELDSAKFEIHPEISQLVFEKGLTLKRTTISMDDKDQASGSSILRGPYFLIKRGSCHGRRFHCFSRPHYRGYCTLIPI